MLLTKNSLAVAFALALAAAAAPHGPASAEVPSGAAIDGIRCDQMEGAVFHIHQHLTVLDHGKPIQIPSDIGRPVVGGCLYWLHTHTNDGIIHVESPAFRTFTLGQLFDIWGQPLTPTNVAGIKVKKGDVRVYLDGVQKNGDPRKIELTQHADIVIEAGSPYDVPKPFDDWRGQ